MEWTWLFCDGEAAESAKPRMDGLEQTNDLRPKVDFADRETASLTCNRAVGSWNVRENAHQRSTAFDR